MLMRGIRLRGFYLVAEVDSLHLQNEIFLIEKNLAELRYIFGICTVFTRLPSSIKVTLEEEQGISISSISTCKEDDSTISLLLPIFSVCLLQSFNLDPPLAEVLIRNLQSNFIPLLKIHSVIL